MKRINLLPVQSGFTLIELLLVMTVIGLISSLGVGSFIGYNRSQTISQATANFVNSLNTAKSRAYSQVKPDSIAACSGINAELNGYGIAITIHSYTLKVSCSGTIVPVSSSATTNLPNISLTSTSPFIFFQVLTGGVIGNGNVTITDNYGNSKTVTISPVGVINVQ